MNPWQFAQQIKHELEQVAWPDGSAEVVFGTNGSVVVFAGAVTEDDHPPGFPFALVTIDAGTPDADHPELLEQTFSVLTAAEVAGDPLGEFAVIGGARADIGTSAGAGVAEVAERVRAAIQNLAGADGVRVMLSSVGTGAPGIVGRSRHLAFDELSVEALCTSQPFYTPPQELVVSGSTWTWTDQAAGRFDFLQYRLGHVAGATPAEDPADLDAVDYTGTAATASVTPSGGRAYSVFADYDPRGTGSVALSSKGNLTGTFVTT